MEAGLRLLFLGVLYVAGCAAAPLDQARLEAINDALANRAAIAKKCGIAEPDRSAAFLSEAGQSRLTAVAKTIIANAQTEEAEYICTPEMFEQSQTAADEAQAEWDRTRGMRQ